MTDTATRDFLVPDLGEGLADATVTAWQVAVGDDVALNQVLCTVETNKAEVEIPSPYAGRVVELGGAAGDTLDVGALLVRFETPSTAPATAGINGAVRKPVLVGYGADADMDASRRPAGPVSPRPRAAPPVRKLAAQRGVDLHAVAPSGRDGVITRDDVLATSSDVQPVQGVQAEMARRMSLSRTEIPDAHATVTVDCTALLRWRDTLRDAAGEDDPPVTPFVLVLRLLTLALRRHPLLNATWVETADGPQVHRHGAVHLGIAVAAPRGLLVPVITDAGGRTTRQLAAEVARLVAGARAGRLTPGELAGSTFTVSNFGALGLDDGVPVINHPEAAIIGLGALKRRAVVVGDDIVARPTMPVTCAFDHRVADGAQVGGFLRDLRALIESPERALLDL